MSEAKLKFPVIKYNHAGKRQNRSLVLSASSVQNCSGNSVQWERPAQEVHGFHRSSREPKTFVLSFLQTYRFDVDSKEQVDQIAQAFERLGLGRVLVDDVVMEKTLDPSYVPPADEPEEPAQPLSRPDTASSMRLPRPLDNKPVLLGAGLDEDVEYLAESGIGSSRPGEAGGEFGDGDISSNPIERYRFIRPPKFPVVPETLPRIMRPQNFELVSTLGKGSFGKVFLVRRVDDSRFFAMKVLKKRAILDRRQIQHMQAELTILQALRHRNMIRLFHAFQTRTRIFLVISYAQGGELFHHLKRVGKFPEQLAVFYLSQLVQVLSYLHGLDIVFRDTKPENMLLDSSGNLLLTDFGLSKMGVSGDTAYGGGTLGQTHCGTPGYLAGEVIAGCPHGKSVDIYALGVFLYEMLVGLDPFTYGTPTGAPAGAGGTTGGGNVARTDLYRRILKGTVVMPHFVSAEARDFIGRCLERRPTDRPNFAEIRAHPLFSKSGIDWERLEAGQISPPFKPKLDPICVQAVEGKLLRSPGDNVYKYVTPEALVSNFDNRFTSEPPTLQASTPQDGVSVEEEKLFRDFAWTAQDAFS